MVLAVPVPPGTKGRACDVSIGKDRLRVGLKGQPPVLGEPCCCCCCGLLGLCLRVPVCGKQARRLCLGLHGAVGQRGRKLRAALQAGAWTASRLPCPSPAPLTPTCAPAEPLPV